MLLWPCRLRGGAEARPAGQIRSAHSARNALAFHRPPPTKEVAKISVVGFCFLFLRYDFLQLVAPRSTSGCRALRGILAFATSKLLWSTTRHPENTGNTLL